MKYLIKYKIFEDITEEEESMIIDDLNDIYHDIRDKNLKVTVSSDRRGRVLGDSLRVEIHGIVGEGNVVDFSLPTFKLGDIIESIYRTEEFLKPYNYLIQPIFAIKVHVGGGKRVNDESQFINLDDLERYSNKECSHVSLNWRIPIDYKEMTKRLRGNSDD
jgi:hypothetical protein